MNVRNRSRSATELDKVFMQQHIRRYIDAGASDEQLSSERKWLSEVFLVPDAKINAITAHARIRFNKAVPNELTIANAEFARHWVRLACTEQERQQYQAEIAALLKVEIELIRSLTDGVLLTDEHDDTQLDAELIQQLLD